MGHVSFRLKWMLKIREDGELPAMAKFLALTLATYMDEHGRCRPSVVTLAAKMHVDRKTVQRHLPVLEQGGYLCVNRKLGGSVNDTHRYEATLPSDRNATVSRSSSDAGGTEHSAPGTPYPDSQSSSRDSASAERDSGSHELVKDPSPTRPDTDSVRRSRAEAVAVPISADVRGALRRVVASLRDADDSTEDVFIHTFGRSLTADDIAAAAAALNARHDLDDLEVDGVDPLRSDAAWLYRALDARRGPTRSRDTEEA